MTVVYPDGTAVEYNTPEEMRTALQEWKQNNPDSTEHPVLKFPFDVKFPNGKVVTVENKEDLKKLIRKCIKFRRHHKRGKGGKGRG